MTPEEAIEELKEEMDVFKEGIDSKALKNPNAELKKILEANDLAIKALEQTSWIPVSERLPKANEYVGNVSKYYLVQNEYGDMLVASYTHSGYWEQIYQLKPIADEIVAWMPLPQPYKAESDKEGSESE